jgi:hypothetical protein
LVAEIKLAEIKARRNQIQQKPVSQLALLDSKKAANDIAAFSFAVPLLTPS